MSLYGVADMLYRREPPSGRGGAAAMTCGDRSLTSAGLRDYVQKLANGLSDAGFARGDRCAIYLYNRLEYLPLVFAVAHLGGVVVPLNYLLKPSEVRHALGDSRSRWLVSEAALWETVEAVTASAGDEVRQVAVDGRFPGALAWTDLMQRGVHAPMVTVQTDDLFLLQYSSGTTGFPKAALHTHGSVLFNAVAQIVDFDLTAADVHLVVPALCWGAGMHCLTFGAMWRGASIVIRPSGGMSGDDVCELIERYRATTMMLAPSVLRILLASESIGGYDLSSVRLVLSGGEPVAPHQLVALRRLMPAAKLMQGYGLSEFPTTMAFLDEDEVESRNGAAGWPSLLARVRVVDEVDEDLPAGAAGEIVVRAPSTARGYHAQPEATQSMLRDGWLHTGDRGWLDDDGCLHVAGRVKDMFISGGLNVYPPEVERVLDGHPAVRESAVVPVSDPRYGEVGHAIVVVGEHAEVSPEHLATLCRDKLANFKVPRTWELRRDPLPRNASGKVQKFLLRAAAPDPQL
jgi:fatty-acyl-CoA synthase